LIEKKFGDFPLSMLSDRRTRGEFAAINIKRADFHGEWNYAISPNTVPQIARLFCDRP